MCTHLGLHWPLAGTCLVQPDFFFLGSQYACMRVCPPFRLLITIGMIWTPYNWLNKFYNFIQQLQSLQILYSLYWRICYLYCCTTAKYTKLALLLLLGQLIVVQCLFILFIVLKRIVERNLISVSQRCITITFSLGVI